MASHSTSTTSAGLYHGSGLTKAAAGAGSGSGVPAVGVAVGSVDDDDVSLSEELAPWSAVSVRFLHIYGLIFRILFVYAL
jgi:hypothetical protein